MKKFLIAAAVLASATGVAQAADPIMMDPPVIAAPAFDWTGFYIGGQLGVIAGNATYVAPNVAPTVIPFTSATGFLAGVHAGANAQFDSFVLGVEGDVEWAGISGNDGGAGGVVDSYSATWQASGRIRAGFAVDTALFYVTGGFGAIPVAYSLDAAAPGGAQTQTQTLGGYVVGVGAEIAVTENLTVRGEYRYANYGTTTYTFNGNPVNARNLTLDTHSFRAGLSWLF